MMLKVIILGRLLDGCQKGKWRCVGRVVDGLSVWMLDECWVGIYLVLQKKWLRVELFEDRSVDAWERGCGIDC